MGSGGAGVGGGVGNGGPGRGGSGMSRRKGGGRDSQGGMPPNLVPRCRVSWGGLGPPDSGRPMQGGNMCQLAHGGRWSWPPAPGG